MNPEYCIEYDYSLDDCLQCEEGFYIDFDGLCVGNLFSPSLILFILGQECHPDVDLNCIACAQHDDHVCELCDDLYFLDIHQNICLGTFLKSKFLLGCMDEMCLSCDEQGCLICDKDTSADEDGYCEDCDTTDNYSSDCQILNTNCQCDLCEHRYNLRPESCDLYPTDGYYFEINPNVSKMAQECGVGCGTCIGSNIDQCTSCSSNSYLDKGGFYDYQEGRCEVLLGGGIQEFNIFVNQQNPNDDVQTRTGALNDPMTDLANALAKVLNLIKIYYIIGNGTCCTLFGIENQYLFNKRNAFLIQSKRYLFTFSTKYEHF